MSPFFARPLFYSTPPSSLHGSVPLPPGVCRCFFSRRPQLAPVGHSFPPQKTQITSLPTTFDSFFVFPPTRGASICLCFFFFFWSRCFGAPFDPPVGVVITAFFAFNPNAVLVSCFPLLRSFRGGDGGFFWTVRFF